jgi:hypothetical protein
MPAQPGVAGCPAGGATLRQQRSVGVRRCEGAVPRAGLGRPARRPPGTQAFARDRTVRCAESRTRPGPPRAQCVRSNMALAPAQARPGPRGQGMHGRAVAPPPRMCRCLRRYRCLRLRPRRCLRRCRCLRTCGCLRTRLRGCERRFTRRCVRLCGASGGRARRCLCLCGHVRTDISARALCSVRAGAGPALSAADGNGL